VRHPRPCMLKRPHFAFINVNTVSRQYFGIKQVLLLDVGDHWHSLFVAHGLHFRSRLAEMGMQWHVKLCRQRRTGLQDLGGAGIGRMGRYRWHNQGVILPPHNEIPCSCQ